MQQILGIVPNSLSGSDFLIERFSVNPALNQVSSGTHVTHLEPKAMQLLVFMAGRSGTVLSREVLLNAIWGDAFVSDQVLSNAISQIRHAFGDEGKDYIQTISKSGYLLKVRPVPVNGDTPKEAPSSSPAAPGIPNLESAGPQPKLLEGMTTRNQLRRKLLLWFAACAALLASGVAIYFLTKPPIQKIRSLAVLPLENLSGNAEENILVDGIHDELTSTLGRIGALEVRSRTSSMHYRNTDKTVPTIARELKVDAVLEGSVRHSGKRLLVTLQLIEAATDHQIWSKTYDRELMDVLQLESEIATDVADQVKAAIAPAERARFASNRRVVPEAYEAYLKGRISWYKSSREGLDTALEYFQLALEKDPNYAPAYAGISQVWQLRAHTGLVVSGEGYAKSRAAAARSLELDDTLADAHEALAGYLFAYQWDWAAAEKEYLRAIELNPNYANAYCFYSFLLFAVGRPQEAKVRAERALELDPYNAFFNYAMAMPQLYQGQLDEALASLHKAENLQPDSYFTHHLLWLVYAQQGEYDTAVGEAKEAFRLLGAPEVAEAIESGYARGGYEEALRRAVNALVLRSNRPPFRPTEIARIYAQLGDKERALDWLEKAYQQRTSLLVYLNVNSNFDSLRGDPRFQALLDRMNFPK